MRWLAAMFASIALAGSLPAAGLDCASCHDEQAQAFPNSVHSALACTDCHASVKAVPHGAAAAKVKCASCHADVPPDVASSVHAHAAEQPCTACHGDPHAILPSKDPKSATYAMNQPRTCGKCHDGESARKSGRPGVYERYIDSIHGLALTKDGLLVAASCSSCHGSHRILARTDPASRVFRKNIPATCGACHQGPLNDYSAGIHGQKLALGDAKAPVCSDCHSAHQIARVGTAAGLTQTTATCGGCHKKQLTTYHDTLHAQVSALGFVEVAHCWDCHDSHKILPASDPNSTVAAANLIKTCGKCHPEANRGFTGYQPHADWHDAKRFPLVHYSNVFMISLLASVLGFFTLHTALWLIRSGVEHVRHGRRV